MQKLTTKKGSYNPRQVLHFTDLASDLTANRRGLESFDSHFPIRLMGNKHVLERLMEFGEISKDISF